MPMLIDEDDNIIWKEIHSEHFFVGDVQDYIVTLNGTIASALQQILIFLM